MSQGLNTSLQSIVLKDNLHSNFVFRLLISTKVLRRHHSTLKRPFNGLVYTLLFWLSWSEVLCNFKDWNDFLFARLYHNGRLLMIVGCELWDWIGYELSLMCLILIFPKKLLIFEVRISVIIFTHLYIE